MLRLLYLFCLLVLVAKADAQSLQGYVVDGESGLPLGNVTVVNVKTQKSTLTDITGFFSIGAGYNDQVAFSLQGYKAVYKPVPFSRGQAEMRVEMQRLSFELEEFVLRPGYSAYQIDSMERKAVYSRALSRHKSTVGSPVSFIAEKFSKKAKRIFRFQKNFNIWEDQKFIDTRYTPQLVEQLTGLQGDTLAHFMNAFPLPYDFARAASDLEVKVWIRENYKAWRKNPVIPFTPTHDSGINPDK